MSQYNDEGLSERIVDAILAPKSSPPPEAPEYAYSHQPHSVRSRPMSAITGPSYTRGEFNHRRQSGSNR